MFATAERWPMGRDDAGGGGDVGVAAAAASETGKRGRIMGDAAEWQRRRARGEHGAAAVASARGR